MRILLSILTLVGGGSAAVVPTVAGFIQGSHQSSATPTSGYENLAHINDPAYIENQILTQENRSFKHSFLTPTGYFLEKGKEYTIAINKDAKANDLLYLSIGQNSTYQGLNGGQNVGFETRQFLGNQVTITPQNSGMLYLKDYRFTQQVKILTISNDPIKVPPFIVNQTHQDAFFKEIATTKSFFVEIISQHVFGTFQTQMFKDQVIPVAEVNINDTILAWDRVWNYTNEVYGLNEAYGGVAKKYPQFIQIANPDSGNGDYAYTTNYYVAFHNRANAGRDLFTRKPDDQWGLWHEFGHTYQTPQYTWSNLVEVTVNISSLYIQQKLRGTASRLDTESVINPAKAFLASTAKDKDYNKLTDLFVKLLMFWQLQMAFGDNFYPTLAQNYRTDHLGVVDQQQDFIINTSTLVKRNLLPFFEKWGLATTAETRNLVSQLPPLKNKIWENVVNNTHQAIREWQLPKYQVATIKDKIDVKKPINFGLVVDKNNFKDNFNLNLNTNIQTDQVYFDWMGYDLIDGKYYVPVRFTAQDKQGLKNSSWSYAQVSFDNTILLVGYAYYQRGLIGLNAATHEFFFAGSYVGLDVTEKPNTYYTITIRDQNDQLVKEFSLTGADNVASTIIREHLANLSYQPGYTLEIKTKIINKNRLFDPTTNVWATNNTYQTKYRIINDKLVKL